MTQNTPTPTEQANNSHYTAKDIQVLEGREAVRRRPGMYIGSTDQRGLHHLVYEIVYNSLDEAMAGCCTLIKVILLQDGSVRVEDNGRGIPVEIHPDTKVSALETVMTTLHAGAKFGGQTYKVSGGLHGVGASVVNALSIWFRVDVKRDGHLYTQEYKRGIPVKPVRAIGEASDTGTTVTFLADEETFGKPKYDFGILSERIREMAYLNKGVEISIRDEKADNEKTFYFEGGITSFVRYLNRSRVVVHPTPIYISGTSNSTITEAALQYNDGFSESIFTFANCVNTIDGGTHLTGFRSAITRVLNDYAHKAKFLKDDDPNLTGDDVREGLTAIVSVKLHEPQFEGQTKGKLGNQEVKGIVESITGEGLALYLEEHPDDARKIIEKCLTAARAREAARKAHDLIIKKSSLDTGTLPGKLADCSDKDPRNNEIYLVEGESAGGSAKQARNRAFQAILPLRGKILNVEKAAPDKMLAHEEIRAIITALGTSIDEELDLNRLRYHRVILMTDADVDGSHIRTLLLTFFFRHMVELITQGHLFIAQPPLYRVGEGKAETWVASDEELDRVIAEKTFGDVSLYSQDKSVTITGKMLAEYISSLKELGRHLDELEKGGIPREFSDFVLQKDESFYRQGFTTFEEMKKIRDWFESFKKFTLKSYADPDKGEYWIELNLKGGKVRFDRKLFEDPLLQQCFKLYPKVEHLAKGKSYTILKKGKEIGKDIPWHQLAEVLEKLSPQSRLSIQRYKGLGEMSAEQLWSTTMDPEKRTLLTVNIEDAAKADHIFSVLMGEEVAPRKAFIQAHAKSVKNLDI